MTGASRDGFAPGSQGLELHWQLWEAPSARLGLMLLHGLGEHSGRYADFARFLASSGITVFSFDLRGHGTSQGIRGHADAFPRFLEDLLAMEGEMAGLVGPALPLAIMGHSMGGLIVLRRAQAFAGPYSGVVLSAPWLRTAKPDWFRSVARALAWALPEVPFPSGTDPRRLTRDPKLIQSIREDPLIHRRITGRLFREAERVQDEVLEFPGGPDLPFLFLVPGNDPVVQSSVTEEFARGFASGRVRVDILEGRLHEPLNDVGREEVYQTAKEWLLSLVEEGPPEAEIP